MFYVRNLYTECDHKPHMHSYDEGFTQRNTFDVISVWKRKEFVSQHKEFSVKRIISFQGCDCSELLDWLFDKNSGILRHEETGNHGNNQSWPFQGPNVSEGVGCCVMLKSAADSS